MIPAFVAAWLGEKAVSRLSGALPYIAAAGAGIAFTVVVYQTGVRSERRAGEARALRAELATVRIDMQIANNLAEQADRDRAAEETRRIEQEGKARDFEAELARRPAGACRWDGADPRRLRDAGR
jgi:hypothetical protein